MKPDESLIALVQIRSNGRVCHRLANILSAYTMSFHVMSHAQANGDPIDTYIAVAQRCERILRRFLHTGEIDQPAI